MLDTPEQIAERIVAEWYAAQDKPIRPRDRESLSRFIAAAIQAEREQHIKETQHRARIDAEDTQRLRAYYDGELVTLRRDLATVHSKANEQYLRAQDLERQLSACRSEAAAIRAERAARTAAEEDNAALLTALREIDLGYDGFPAYVQRLLNRISEAEHPGRALMAAMTRRMAALETERDAARAEAKELQQLQDTIIRMRDGGHELPGSLMEETFRWEEARAAAEQPP